MSENERVREVGRWLRYAREDLQAAEALIEQPNVAPRHVCWLAQQSAEKAIKAALIFLEIDFPRQHDLDALRQLMPLGWRTKEEFADLVELTEWAVEARYPGDWPEPTLAEAQAALEQARAILAAVCDDLAHHGCDIETLG
jgi:HEPN domain-containing protein